MTPRPTLTGLLAALACTAALSVAALAETDATAPDDGPIGDGEVISIDDGIFEDGDGVVVDEGVAPGESPAEGDATAFDADPAPTSVRGGSEVGRGGVGAVTGAAMEKEGAGRSVLPPCATLRKGETGACAH